MLFHSTEYAVFLLVVFVLFWLVSRWPWPRLLLLMVSSFLFYASWSRLYLLLMLTPAFLDYFLAMGMARTEDPKRRKWLLVTSMVTNLGLLAVFKYYNFFMDSVDQGLDLVGSAPLVELLPEALKRWARLEVLLPVGISFYTFQTMSYTIDVYRREITPKTSFTGVLDFLQDVVKFLVFVSFFPQLVAGPIVRAIDFLPQLEVRPTLSAKEVSRGAALIMGGLIKKLVIGDYLAVNLVDRVFETPNMFSSFEVLLGVYGYAMQIYCDFSGYTDIAIGSALLFGYTLTLNFNRPYQADSLQEFWHRWHISLSTWLRDYLYIPLGGNRGGPWGTYRNLILTMLLGGLWHGAAWTFVIWGAMHGGTLMLTRLWQRWRKERGANPKPGLAYRLLMVFLTFHFVCLTWIMFRATSLEQAWGVMARIGQLVPGTTNVAWTVALALAAGYGIHATPTAWRERLIAAFHRLPVWLQAPILVGILWALREAATSQVVPFIYFQF